MYVTTPPRLHTVKVMSRVRIPEELPLEIFLADGKFDRHDESRNNNSYPVAKQNCFTDDIIIRSELGERRLSCGRGEGADDR